MPSPRTIITIAACTACALLMAASSLSKKHEVVDRTDTATSDTARSGDGLPSASAGDGAPPAVGEAVKVGAAGLGEALPSSDDDMQYRPQKLPDAVREMPSVEAVREFFRDVLVIMMMSPPRYHLVETVHRHYAPFFTHMYFCGPQTNHTYKVPITGYDIVYGNEQYRAVRLIIQQYESTNEIPNLAGYLYIADDLMLQPWSLINHNKSNVWATQMGIANLRSGRTVTAVPGMTVEGRFRKDWPYWKKNRGKLMGALKEGGPAMRAMLRRSAVATPPSIYKYSHYGTGFRKQDDLEWAIFFTIVDTYYVPRRLALRYAERCVLMAKHWVFGECAIATALRSIEPTYEPMHVQFYWSTLNAGDCPRYRWGIMLTGFHRCRHDHFFAEAIYDADMRARIAVNATLRRALLSNSYKG